MYCSYRYACIVATIIIVISGVFLFGFKLNLTDLLIAIILAIFFVLIGDLLKTPRRADNESIGVKFNRKINDPVKFEGKLPTLEAQPVIVKRLNKINLSRPNSIKRGILRKRGDLLGKNSKKKKKVRFNDYIQILN